MNNNIILPTFILDNNQTGKSDIFKMKRYFLVQTFFYLCQRAPLKVS